jgi:hypothetical protein
MIGGIAIIFFLLPESPWWLVSKGKSDKAAKILNRYNGRVPEYSVQDQIVCNHHPLLLLFSLHINEYC